MLRARLQKARHVTNTLKRLIVNREVWNKNVFSTRFTFKRFQFLYMKDINEYSITGQTVAILPFHFLSHIWSLERGYNFEFLPLILLSATMMRSPVSTLIADCNSLDNLLHLCPCQIMLWD